MMFNLSSYSNVTLYSLSYPLEYNSLSYPLKYTLPLTLSYSILLIFGIIGNALAFTLILSNQKFHSTTNVLLCNLALSDALLLTGGIGADMSKIWFPWQPPSNDWYCRLECFLKETTTDVSVMTICALTFHHWRGIACNPLRHPVQSGVRKRWLYAIGAIWLVAVCSSAPYAYQFSVIYVPSKCQTDIATGVTICMFDLYAKKPFGNNYSEEYGQCDVQDPTPALTETLSALFLFLPMVLMTFSYGRIIRMVYSSYRPDGKVICLLVVMVMIFFISHLPFHVQRIVHLHSQEDLDFQFDLWISSGVMRFFSAASNPYLYFIFSRQFRLAFRIFVHHNRQKLRHLWRRIRSFCRSKCHMFNTDTNNRRQIRLNFYRQPAAAEMGAGQRAAVQRQSTTSDRKKLGIKLRRRLFSFTSPDICRFSVSMKEVEIRM